MDRHVTIGVGQNPARTRHSSATLTCNRIEHRMFLLELLVIVSIPAIYVAGFAFFAGASISHLWFFVILMLTVLYVLYVAVFTFLPVSPGGYYIDTAVSANGGTEYVTKSTDGRVESSLLRTYIAPIAVFSLVAFPLLALALRRFRR